MAEVTRAMYWSGVVSTCYGVCIVISMMFLVGGMLSFVVVFCTFGERTTTGIRDDRTVEENFEHIAKVLMKLVKILVVSISGMILFLVICAVLPSDKVMATYVLDKAALALNYKSISEPERIYIEAVSNAMADKIKGESDKGK